MQTGKKQIRQGTIQKQIVTLDKKMKGAGLHNSKKIVQNNTANKI